jgi:hydrogenase expression/formation protein HypE
MCQRRAVTGVPLPTGKVPSHLLALLLDEVGLSSEVRVGPAIGEDGCAIEVPPGFLVAATDPITFTGADVGRLAVIVNANDVAVMGARPRWFLATVLLPQGTTDIAVRELFAALRAGLSDVGAVLVGGHTELTAAVTRPLVVGQMLGVVDEGKLVATRNAQVGDVVVQIGPVPVEGAAVLAVEAAARLGGVDQAMLHAAARAFDNPGVCVVEAALLAAELGATALHDLTEGGMAAGLHELARAAGVSIRVDTAAIRWFPPGVAVCRALGADPWATLASGAVLAAFAPDDAANAVDTLAERGHPASTIGVVEPGGGVRDLAGRRIAWPNRDEVARLLSS